MQQIITQYVINWDLQAHKLSSGNTLEYALVYRRSRPKHAVSERLLTLAEDMMPEATLIIVLS
jgi:hypothetical protein